MLLSIFPFLPAYKDAVMIPIAGWWCQNVVSSVYINCLIAQSLENMVINNTKSAVPHCFMKFSGPNLDVYNRLFGELFYHSSLFSPTAHNCLTDCYMSIAKTDFL